MTLAQNSRYAIWDDPGSGVVNVTMAELKEEDSGSYLCATRGDSKSGFIPYKHICLVVTSGEYFAEGRGLSGPRT